jgi:nicotinate-nucleotide adenylyltransferase
VTIAILGGTFDPPHLAHLIAAELAVDQFQLDRLLFVPARISPLKTRTDVSDAADRLAMLTLAIQDNPKFDVSTIELEREGPSYTIDTIRQIREQYTPDEICLLIGRDQFEQFASWREPEEILKLANVIVLDRPGNACSILEHAAHRYIRDRNSPPNCRR